MSEHDDTNGGLKVFINYRRDDTAGEARLVYDRLAPRFGKENVFLDVVSIESGMQWLEQLKLRGQSCSAFLALIGREWMPSMKARARARVVDPIDDYVKVEIETALRRRPGVTVIPVLVGDSPEPPVADELPRPIRALAELQAERLRLDSLDQDMARLMERLERIPGEGEQAPAEQPARARSRRFVPQPAPDVDSAHYEEVLGYMVEEGSVVPLLGSRVNTDSSGERSLPDAEQLATDPAQRFDFDGAPHDLAAVAQYVFVTRGSPFLYKTLKQILTVDTDASPVHRFLARFPKTLEELGLPKRYQMIVTTNYDNALECAFDNENEPYDLAVYMASGADRGKFVHFPYDGAPEAVAVPNRYGKFPIDDYGDLDRTVIIKIHGAVDGNMGDYRWKENYIITEDQYIDYLSTRPAESLVPVQILEKLRGSHCLFLGYNVNDWNLRVFLKRIWRDVTIDAQSWAVEPDPDVLEDRFWRRFGVNVIASGLHDYVSALNASLAPHARTPAEP